MGTLKKLARVHIRKIIGGRDPINLIEEFIVRRGNNPEECSREQSKSDARWMLPIAQNEELEICAQGLDHPNETTIYMGVNVASVPLKGSHDILVSALEIADGLIGIKVSLVGHYLVLSATFPASGLSVEEIDYSYEMIVAQMSWFRSTLADELGIEELPED